MKMGQFRVKRGWEEVVNKLQIMNNLLVYKVQKNQNLAYSNTKVKLGQMVETIIKEELSSSSFTRTLSIAVTTLQTRWKWKQFLNRETRRTKRKQVRRPWESSTRSNRKHSLLTSIIKMVYWQRQISFKNLKKVCFWKGWSIIISNQL